MHGLPFILHGKPCKPKSAAEERRGEAPPSAVDALSRPANRGWIRAISQTHRDDGCVQAIYPDDGAHDPDAEPGVAPETEIEADGPSVTLEVDGEAFAMRPDEQGGTAYTWLNGPNPGYGFSLSPTGDLSRDEHRGNIRDFLVDIDPATGYLRED